MDNNTLSKKLENQANGDEPRLDRFPPGWNFKDSFPGLDLFPFNQLAVEDACLIDALQDEAEYRPWEGGPAERNKCIHLQKGRNFAAWLKLEGFSSILTLLGNLVGTNSTFMFYGPFNPNQDDGYAGTILSAELSNGEFRIGCDPLTFTLSHPRVVVKVAKGEDGAPDIGLALHADFLGLDFSVAISSTADRLTFGAEPIQGKAFTLKNVLPDLPGGIGNFQGFLPDELRSVFEPVVQGVGLKHLDLIMQTDTREIRYWEISVDTTMPWEIIPTVVTLKNLILQVGALKMPGISNPLYMVSTFATAELLPEIFKGEFDFAVSIEKAAVGEWQVTSIRGQYFGKVTLGKIVSTLLKVQETTLPAELKGISFSDFGVIVHPAVPPAKGSEGRYECYGTCLAEFPLLGSQLRSSLVINVEYSTTQGYKVYLGGVLEIAGQSFSLTVDFSGQKGGGGNLRLTASWEALSLDSYLQVEDIVRALGSTQDMPPGLDLSLKSASFTYDFKGQTLVLQAESMNYGKVVFAVCKRHETPEWQFFVGVAVNDISLPRLPLVEDMLPGRQTIKGNDDEKAKAKIVVDEIKLLGVSTALDANIQEQKDEIGTINGLIDKAYPTIPEQGLSAAFVISARLNLLDEYFFPLSTGTTKQPGGRQPVQESTNEEGQTGALVVRPTSLPSPGADSTAGDVTWFSVNQSIGPVSLRRVGAQYKDGALWLFLDASLAAAGLQLSLIGLAVGSPLDTLKPMIDISGLALSYTNPPLEIAGAFDRSKEDKNKYSGEAILKTDKFSLSAVGLYADVDPPSMFVYAFLDYPLGGPPIFYVTGLAAGFGFNRKLVMPSIDQVQDFPLVADVIGEEQPDKTSGGGSKLDLAGFGKEQSDEKSDGGSKLDIDRFGKYVVVQTGQYFLAAGVKFTSFKMIDSFAMLAVSFGQRLQIDLVGISTIMVPYSDDKTKPSLSEIEIAFKASFIPDVGLVEVLAQLTPSSYILAKDNHPTGGLAFRTWFAGDHNGDFVLSVGGYHSKFQVPAHYPLVPRLALSWQVSSCLSIKGDAYFALTPSMLMAGGNLEASWHSGPLEAWFKAQADFLIAWQPFHYDAQMLVNMGIAYTFQINTWFGSWTQRLTAELGTDLHIWGPDFSGIAHVRVSFISFDVAFGAGAADVRDKIGADEFVAAFLPKDLLSVSVKDGLIKSPPEHQNTELGTFDPQNLSLVIDSVVPIRKSPNPSPPIEDRKFGVAPVKIPQLNTELTITITRLDDNQDCNQDCTADFDFVPISKNVPAALWGTSFPPDRNGDSLIEGVTSGFEIRPKHQKVEPFSAPSDGTAAASVMLESRGLSKPGSTTIAGVQQVVLSQPALAECSLGQGTLATAALPAITDPWQTIKDSLRTANGRRQNMLKSLGFESEAITIDDSLAETFVAAPQIEG